MIEKFTDYVSQFNMKIDGIEMKYRHSIRVMNLCNLYAKKLGFDDSDVELAGIIGLLHDIGRFKQYAMYQSFDDLVTFDHADYGVKLLFDDGLISNFTDRINDYDIIKFAIRNHNKLVIEKCDNDRFMKFAKLIRDIDKLDIVYLLGCLKEFEHDQCNDLISEGVINSIKRHESVKNSDVLNLNDKDVSVLAFPFDINYNIVLYELRNYLYSYYMIINHDGIFDEVYREVVNYIDERIDEDVR